MDVLFLAVCFWYRENHVEINDNEKRNKIKIIF